MKHKRNSYPVYASRQEVYEWGKYPLRPIPCNQSPSLHGWVEYVVDGRDFFPVSLSWFVMENNKGPEFFAREIVRAWGDVWF
jgi:hypothetical protein